MKNGKKLIASAIIATTVLVAATPASAADTSDVAKGAILGIITGAIIANAHNDHNEPNRVVYREPRRIAYHAPRHVEYREPRYAYYDAPTHYTKHVYIKHSYEPQRVHRYQHHHKYSKARIHNKRWNRHDR